MYILMLLGIVGLNSFPSYAVVRDHITNHEVGISVDKVTITGNPDTKSITINMDGITMRDTPESYRGGHNGGNTWYYTEVGVHLGKRINSPSYGDREDTDIGWTVPQLPGNILEYIYVYPYTDRSLGWVEGEKSYHYVDADYFKDTCDNDGGVYYGRNRLINWAICYQEISGISDLMISKGIDAGEAYEEYYKEHDPQQKNLSEKFKSGLNTYKYTTNTSSSSSPSISYYSLRSPAAILTWLRKNNYKQFIVYDTPLVMKNEGYGRNSVKMPNHYVVIDVATGKVTRKTIGDDDMSISFNAGYGARTKQYSGGKNYPSKSEIYESWKWRDEVKCFGPASDKGKISFNISGVNENLTRVPITFWCDATIPYDNCSKGDLYWGFYWLDVSAAVQEALNPNYKINFNANGGSGSMSQMSVKYNQTVALSNCTMSKVGYTFKNWNTQANGGGTAYSNKQNIKNLTAAGKEVTLYAQWTPRTDTKYVVKHQLMNVNGSGYTLKDTETFKGTTDTKVTPATKTYTGFTAPSKQTVNIDANGSRVVTYSYTRNKYTFTLGSNASVYSHGINTSGTSSSGSYYYGATITLKASPKPGYSWSMWSDKNASMSRTFTMPANNLTITPQANLITYTIKYVPYGGTESGNPITYTVESPTITLKNPTMPGYTFLGWTSPNSKELKPTYQIPKGTVGDVVMSANWVSNKLSDDSLNTQGGNGSSDSGNSDNTDPDNARSKNTKTQHNNVKIG